MLPFLFHFSFISHSLHHIWWLTDAWQHLRIHFPFLQWSSLSELTLPLFPAFIVIPLSCVLSCLGAIILRACRKIWSPVLLYEMLKISGLHMPKMPLSTDVRSSLCAIFGILPKNQSHIITSEISRGHILRKWRLIGASSQTSLMKVVGEWWDHSSN